MAKFPIPMNEVDVYTIDELEANLDPAVLIEFRKRFVSWLKGADEEELAAEVKSISGDLSDEDWLLAVADVLGIEREKIGQINAAKQDAEKKKKAEEKKKRKAIAAGKARAAKKREEQTPFLMAIEDVFHIEGRGIVVTGRVERGIVHVNDEAELVGFHTYQKVRITGIEEFRKSLDAAATGMNVGLLLSGVSGKSEVERGMVVALPGSISAHTKFIANIRMLETSEGGRKTSFYNNYRPQFYFRTTDITGCISLLDGQMEVSPGTQTSIMVELIAPIAMENGQYFAIREGGKTDGVGTVIKILD